MIAALALGLSFLAAPAPAQDCVPNFYNAEPRDAEWYYGVGKGADAGAARADALEHLYEKIAGREKEVPKDVVAGWEQDGYGECRGNHYAIDRIEKARAKKNLADALARRAAAAPAASTAPPTINNNITVTQTVAAPPPSEDRNLRYLVLAVVFLGFVIGLVALRRRPSVAPVFGASIDVVQDPKPRPKPADSSIKERFAAVARQPQAEALGEIARLGIKEYLKAHKGEGTCKSVPGSAELVRDGAQEMARRFGAQGWKVSTEGWSCYAVSVEGGVPMGLVFNLYASPIAGYTDCEILYALGAGVDDGMRVKMEEGQHSGLPWTVQAVAMRQGAAKGAE